MGDLGRNIIKRLCQAGSLTAMTAAATLCVVVVSAAGTEASEFRDYTLGYFLGTFATMILYPQFSFYIYQYGSSDRDRLKMLFVSCLLASTLVTTSLVFVWWSLANMLALGALSGILLNTGVYLNTEYFAVALREQALKSYFIVRIISITIPFTAWAGTVLLFGNFIAALLLFEMVRGLVFFVFFGLGFTVLVKANGFPRTVLPPGVFRVMLPRHAIKLCEAVLVAFIPFLAMNAIDGAVAAVRIGFQFGLTLTGILGIVVIPRILRSDKSTKYVKLYVHAVTVVLFLGTVILYAMSNEDFGETLSSFVMGSILALFLPALSLSGALMLRSAGGKAVAGVWSGAVLLVFAMLTFLEPSMLHVIVGLGSVSLGYSIFLLFTKSLI